MKTKRRIIAFLIFSAFFCMGFSEVEEKEYDITALSLEEKVAQMFVITPEALTGIDAVVAAGEATQAAINEIPVGGLIYMEQNLQSEDQVTEMISNVQTFSQQRVKLPMFISTDEEGGTVTRISGRGLFDVPYIGNMSDIGASGDIDLASEAGESIGQYLARMGFNLDFAPDADVLSNPYNEVVRYRSFGSDANLVSAMTQAVLDGLKENGIYGTLKHFPGHGATEGDSHAGYAYTSKTLEELQDCELVPFQEGIANGVSFIMVGHIAAPNVVGDDTPASLSSVMITDILREQMGYDGLVITDALNMGAIVQSYSSAEAAIRTIQAGGDLILMPADFRSAYYGVLDAVNNGTISEERIDESVERILKVKLEMEKEE